MFQSPHQLAARGASVLDEIRPGWENEIDTDKLAIWDGDRCIIGQLSGTHYVAGIDRVFGPDLDADNEFFAEHGFNTCNVSAPVELDGAWIYQIERRRAA